MDVNDAWERFQKSEEPFTSFRKASVNGTLDTIAAMGQQILDGQERLLTIVPKIMGDETALDTDEEDPLDIILGNDSGQSEPPAAEEAQPAPPEQSQPAPEGTVQKAEDDTDVRDMEEAVADDAEPEETPAEPVAEEVETVDEESAPDAPAPSDEITEEVAVEPVEGAGQEGLPPEGVPDLTDEINENQPEGLLNIYGRFIEGMKRAAAQAAQQGSIADVTNIAGAQNAIDSIWKTQVAPVMDGLNGTDRFARSCDRTIRKSGSMEITSEIADDGIASSHEVKASSCSTEGEHNTTGHSNDATEAPASEGRVEGTSAPHALNNDTTTVGSDNPPSFEKSCGGETEPVTKDASPSPDMQGMTPVEKSLSDFEGYSEDYEDESSEDDYRDPIRKSVPSFRDVMEESPDERFMKAAEMRHGPHANLDELYMKWYGESQPMESVAKSVEASMTEGEPVAGTDSFEACDSTAKSEGAMTAGTEGADSAVFSDDSVEKSTAGQPGPETDVEQVMKCDTKKAEDQLDELNGAFEKTSTGAPDVDEAMKDPTCGETASTGAEDVGEAMRKSMEVSQGNGKPLPTLNDMISFRKSNPYAPMRPGAIATVNGDITKPQENSFRKAAKAPPVRMGHGVKHEDVVKQDWEDYRLYKAQRGYN